MSAASPPPAVSTGAEGAAPPPPGKSPRTGRRPSGPGATPRSGRRPSVSGTPRSGRRPSRSRSPSATPRTGRRPSMSMARANLSEAAEKAARAVVKFSKSGRTRELQATLAPLPAAVRRDVVNLPDKNGSTAIYHAVWPNHHATLQTLVDAGADVNHQNTRLNTALHLACEQMNMESIEVLILGGAQVDAENSFKKKCYETVEGDRRDQLMAFIERTQEIYEHQRALTDPELRKAAADRLYRKMFNAMDEDGDGFVTLDDLKQFVRLSMVPFISALEAAEAPPPEPETKRPVKGGAGGGAAAGAGDGPSEGSAQAEGEAGGEAGAGEGAPPAHSEITSEQDCFDAAKSVLHPGLILTRDEARQPTPGTDSQIASFFRWFDADCNEKIDFTEFLRGISNHISQWEASNLKKKKKGKKGSAKGKKGKKGKKK